MTAMSVAGSVPTVVALNERPSLSVTLIVSASFTTWLFVSTRPEASKMKPEPDDGTRC